MIVSSTIMAVFDREKTEQAQLFESPEGMYEQRNEVLLDAGKQVEVLKDLADLAKKPEVLTVEVRGGNWIYCSKGDFEKYNTEGRYVAVENPGDTPKIQTTNTYTVYGDGRVVIDSRDRTRGSASDRALEALSFLPSIRMYLKGNPYGLGAGVELEESGPVLRYTEVRKHPFLATSLKIEDKKSNFSYLDFISTHKSQSNESEDPKKIF